MMPTALAASSVTQTSDSQPRCGERAESELRRRQQAEHDGDAAQDLREKHLVEIGGPALEEAQRQSERKQRKAKRG